MTATALSSPRDNAELESDAPLLRKVALHGLTIDVRGLRILHRSVELALRAYPVADPTSEPNFSVTATRVSGKPLAWQIRSGDRLRRASTGVSEAARWIEWMVVSEAFSHWPQFIHVHAGVVATARESGLLIGRAGTGKSTTTTALALEGMQLYSDDVGLIDRSTLQPYCVPRPIKLDSNARHRLRPRGLTIPRKAMIGDSIDRTLIPGLPPVEEPGPPITTAIFFAPARNPTAQLRPITGAEAVMRLIRQSTSESFDVSGPSEGALALINAVRCVEIAAGDLDSTVRTLREFLLSGNMRQSGSG